MKRIIPILLLLLSGIGNHFLIAQCHNLASYTIVLKSYEKTNIDGVLDVSIKLILTDTIEFNKKFIVQTSGFFSGSVQRVFSGQNFLPGDTVLLNYQVTYNTSNLPYYAEKLSFQIKDSTIEDTSIVFDLYGMVYFTPWQTVEVWHLDDYYTQKRIWHISTGTTPDRVFIDKSILPVSDITDTLSDTTGMFYLRHISGLAYDIPFNKPDTFNWENPQDSSNSELGKKADDCGLGFHRFTGKLENFRVFTSYTPPGASTPIKLFLRKAKVELRIDRWPDQVIRKLRTDADGYIIDENGNRSINFSFCTGKGKSQKDIYLAFSMCDPDKTNQLRVKWEKNTNGGPNEDDKWMRYMTRITPQHTLFRSLSHPDVSDFWGTAVSNGDTEFELSWNDLGAIYTLMKIAFDFTNQELEGTGKKLGPNLKVRVTSELTNGNETPHTSNYLENIVLPTTRLREGIIFHEFGHYVFYYFHGRFNWSNAGGHHTLNFNNRNEHMTMSEGVAQGFSAIMDEMTWLVLGQQSDEKGFHQRPKFQKVIKNNIVTGDLNSPYLSESFLGSVILDLWDGPENYSKFNNTNVNGPGYRDLGSDNFEMTLWEIIEIFSNNKGDINGIEDFYNELVNKDSDCDRKDKIQEIFEFNLNDIATDFSGDIGNFPHFNSDEIFEINNFVAIGFKFKSSKISDRVQKDCDIRQYKDITELNSSTRSYNIGSYDEPSPAANEFNWNNGNDVLYITDNLNISNNGVLEVNSANDLHFFNDPDDDFSVSSASRNLNPIEVYVCGKTNIQVKNNGMLKIGDISTEATEANLRISNGSLLSFHTSNINEPAELIINNNSKLIIEDGATLEIFPGSRIILNGDNAILEIRGTLDVKEGATFTFEGGSAGSGHVVFNILYNPSLSAKEHIKLGNNSLIRFVGDDNNDRVMEVPADATFWPDNFQTSGTIQSSFEINNGFVALGHNAMLNIGTAINLNHVKFYAESTSKARSICLWGQEHSINNVILENVKEGIQSYNFVGGWPLKLNNVKVSGADRALLSEGKGSYLTLFESDNNATGIGILGSIWPNIFNYPKVTGATSGTLYTGTAASNLVINYANYDENFKGVQFTGGGTLVLNCGRFHNVHPTTGGNPSGDGIIQSGGNLIVADALGFKGGRVSFADNNNTIVLNKTRFYLNNGYNDLSFISTTSTSGINLALKGSSSFVTGSFGTVPADNNLWDRTTSTKYPPSTLGFILPSGPLGYQNYNISCLMQISGGIALGGVNIPATPFINATQFTTAQENRCITAIEGVSVSKGMEVSGRMLMTTHFNNTNIQEAFSSVLDDMYNATEPDYASVIDRWAELLTEPAYSQPYSEEDYYYIDLAENKMMEVLGLLLSADTTFELSESGQAHFETILDVQNEWINTLQNDTTYMGVELKNTFNFDKGVVYHLEGENSSAQTQWSNMQTWANDLYLEHTDYWLCRLIREEAIKNCGNNPDSVANIVDCQYSESNNAFTTNDNTANIVVSQNKISKHLSLYPNPAATSVSAVLETSQKGVASINIYSIDGRCIQTLPNIALKYGLNKIIISTVNLVSGVYTIAIETPNTKWNEKLVVE